MKEQKFDGEIAEGIPDRMALAGGWIDQPVVSKHNPDAPGSMVVISLEPKFRFMLRSGMATGTKKVAQKIWSHKLPDKNRMELVKELYKEENKDRADEPSGSQDMIGLIYPGVNRLDYDYNHEGGYFPVHIETNTDPEIAEWIEKNMNVLPINQRPDGYNPLGDENLDPEWIRRLGQTGKDCFDGIVNMDINKLGASMNECMECWEAIYPHTVNHKTLDDAEIDLKSILEYYQSRYAGAMYSGCGGGYLFVVSEGSAPVPGAFKIYVRIK